MNTLTDEQLQEIADKGAEETFTKIGHLTGSTMSLTPHGHVFIDLWKKEAPARQAFTRTVIDLALSKMGEGEGDLVTADEIKDNWHLTGGWNDVLSDSINTRHRQAMAALRAQMQGEIDRLKGLRDGDIAYQQWDRLGADRDQWEERAEKAEFDKEWFENGVKNLVICLDRGIKCKAELTARAEAAEKELAALKQQALYTMEEEAAIEELQRIQGATRESTLKSALRYYQKMVKGDPLEGFCKLEQQAPADREAFEKWARKDWRSHSFEKDPSGVYYNNTTFDTWDAWQAALAHKPQPE